MQDFERIYEENQDLVFKYLLKLTKSPDLAEELTQDTFFRAYMNLSSLRHTEKAPTWLCSIAKNRYFAWYNEQKRILPLEQSAIPQAESFEDRFLECELSRDAALCLDRLEQPYRNVFILSVFGKLTLKEISASYSKSESWARVTLHRARQKLKEQLQSRQEDR
ncbi:MAG: sigma-70 family RNA polymerase sigma factor [Clostridia bacterium]|nr:sigma-70 family RNA polymerase sigma factor [Clostridia bacterium]